MAGVLFLDEVKRKRVAIWALSINLLFLHVWVSQIVWALTHSKPDDIDGPTLKAIAGLLTGGITINILLLLSDTVLDLVLALVRKWLGNPMSVPTGVITETTERKSTTITPAPVVEGVMKAGEVNLTAEGPVIVQGEKHG